MFIKTERSKTFSCRENDKQWTELQLVKSIYSNDALTKETGVTPNISDLQQNDSNSCDTMIGNYNSC